ncbi:type IV secretory system conjugative DNA transfer family protein [Deinococcus sp. 6YEL10]|uniref:type IV secretory system conjugative DNA transfer family protein n=1 Tax=Deinococcus sp. 6YEL10 TaxID=2745870 RepID=UPI001E318AFE|nr:type IV secretory system conjugative DNA transfer family protein [Deinococcus sp. 6YEL10]
MTPSQPERPQANPPSPVAIAAMSSTMLAVGVLLMQALDVGQQAASLIFKHTGLAQARHLKEDAMAALLISCGSDAKCGPWLSAQFSAGMAWYWLALLLPVIAIPLTMKFFPSRKAVPQKDPGLARWENKAALKRYMYGSDSTNDPFIGFLGYLKSGEVGGTFDSKDLPPMYIPLEDWCQNTLVWGGIRSGKTTSFFQPNIFLGAHLGITCVVFDVKWPQKDSGFYETIGYWHARKRRTVLLAPYEPYGARVNLIAGVFSFSDALEVADAVFPPPEFMEERGKHYNDKKRFMIAALMWLLRTELGDRAHMGTVLEHAMLPDDRLMEWVETARDEQAKAILTGYRDAGESNFAETKNGIISALKVFFNQDVVRATSGLPTETIQLEECFRQPSLVMVGINQKNMMDGSGEVLFRLYKRLLDAAAMRVAAEQGGRLRVHLAYMMDELPSIGKINYMMRSLGTLRTYNISHHLGIQNDAQGQLVYGEAYWKAITTNVVARVIVFPRGINGDDAKKIRDLIGKTTATEVGVTGSRSIRVLEHEGSNAVSAKLVERDLLSYEEFSQFTLGEAVVRVNGHQPIRTQLAPMTMATVEGSGIKPGSKPNLLHGFYQETITRCPGGLVAYTARIIQDGALAGAPSASPQGGTQDAPSRPVSPQPTPAQGAQGSAANLSVTEVVQWLRACMTELIEIELQLPERVITVRVDAEADPVNGTNAVTRLVIGGLLERTRTASHARLTKKAHAALPADLQADLADYPDAYAVYRWLRDNALSISGTPERAAYEAQCASTEPPTTPTEPAAQVIDGTLLCTMTRTREIFRGEGVLRFPQKRIGSRDHNQIPVQSLAATAAAVRQARAAEAEPTGEGKLSRKEQKRQSKVDLVNSVVGGPPSSP